ncbi:MAG: hypothetical protein IJ341_05755 [Bacteroidales bacterium]|nr:hypothetical protein [Bacteroidales bacterium]
MKDIFSNILNISYMQVSLYTASYFILNYNEMASVNGRFCFDLTFPTERGNLIVNAEYYYNNSNKSKSGELSLQIECDDCDIELNLIGSYSMACDYATDFINEYILRASKVIA